MPTYPSEMPTTCGWCGKVKIGGIYVAAPVPPGPVSSGLCLECRDWYFPKPKTQSSQYAAI